MKTKCCKAPNLKLTKAWTAILTVLLTLVLAAGIVVCAMFGFNYSRKDTKTVTVSVDYYSYQTSGADIEDAVEGVFAQKSLKADDKKYVEIGETVKEIVYVFDKDTSLTALNDAKDLLVGKDVEKGEESKLDKEFPNAFLSVSVEDVKVSNVNAKNYVGRGLIALLIFAVVSFLYVWLRYKLFAALYTLFGNLLVGGLTTAVIALTRVPVTNAVGAVIAASALFSTVTILFFFNKLRVAQKEESASEKSAKEIVSSSIAWKETTLFAALLTVALLVMICVGKSAIAWFSLAAMIGVHVSAFIGLLYLPAIFVPAKKCADKLAVKRASSYKGAKKGEKAKKSDDEEIVD